MAMIQCKSETETLNFDSTSQASKQLNLKRSIVVRCLKGKQKTYKGYSFKELN